MDTHLPYDLIERLAQLMKNIKIISRIENEEQLFSALFYPKENGLMIYKEIQNLRYDFIYEFKNVMKSKGIKSENMEEYCLFSEDTLKKALSGKRPATKETWIKIGLVLIIPQEYIHLYMMIGGHILNMMLFSDVLYYYAFKKVLSPYEAYILLSSTFKDMVEEETISRFYNPK